MNDLKFTIRQLRKSPGFTAVAVLTLTLGIGANTAVFSLINRVLLLPLPFKDPERLVWVRAQDPKNNMLDISATGQDYLARRRVLRIRPRLRCARVRRSGVCRAGLYHDSLCHAGLDTAACPGSGSDLQLNDSTEHDFLLRQHPVAG
jgi:hypothetical protein